MRGVTERMKFGFTLMEFLISIAVVAVLVGIAIPSYVHYMTKTYYSEIVQTGDRYKVAVAACLEERSGTLADCDGGAYGIPPDIVAGAGVGQVNSVTVANSVITVTPKATNGIVATDTYILTPTYSSTNGITWTVSGGGCRAGLVPGC